MIRPLPRQADEGILPDGHVLPDNRDMDPDHPGAAQPEGSSADVDDAYRGFLFADLRGFTEFVERQGDAAAAELLAAYRALVRDAVARFDGAEIRTEGDSFYVVFRSARRAVACGIAIVAAAEEDRRVHLDRPIQVGIGINAGETVQREDGFVGTAVNLAARVCSQARPGEVLITSAVRDAVSGGGGLVFTHRGRRRLKGIAQPVALFAVRAGSAAALVRSTSPLGRVTWIVVVVVAVVLGLGIAGGLALRNGWVASGQLSDGAGGSHSPAVPSPSPMAASASPIANSGADPNEAERALLDVIGEFSDYCERADEDDRPLYRMEPMAANQGHALRVPLNVDAGVACKIQSFGAPDQVFFWSVLRSAEPFDYAPEEAPRQYLINEAGFFGIGPLDCPSDPAAYGPWEFGSVGGMAALPRRPRRRRHRMEL